MAAKKKNYGSFSFPKSKSANDSAIRKPKSGAEYLKQGSLNSSKRTTKTKTGDLASERSVMREAAQRNRKLRSTSGNLEFGNINVTYRDQSGKLKNTVMNRKRGSSFPKSNYLFMKKRGK